ncbi:hypothetical protein Pmani_015927 [Petrolisthes manimaculis]|uniref:Uncharacterized protein n=1 Tax=Petrolisthes manimaculis TaxID=1843537 RepID=A0AAE1UBJ9_9EUCA|nr:hypothetical protein Pmani_015927 [Petrolisthes manimaculis]
MRLFFGAKEEKERKVWDVGGARGEVRGLQLPTTTTTTCYNPPSFSPTPSLYITLKLPCPLPSPLPSPSTTPSSYLITGQPLAPLTTTIDPVSHNACPHTQSQYFYLIAPLQYTSPSPTN